MFVIALSVGLGLAIGLNGFSPWWLVAVSTAMATLHLWRTRSSLRATTAGAWDGQTRGAGPAAGALLIWIALCGLAALLSGIGFGIGKLLS